MEFHLFGIKTRDTKQEATGDVGSKGLSPSESGSGLTLTKFGSKALDTTSSDERRNLSLTLTLKQVRAVEVAKKRLEQRLEFLRWEQEHLQPLLERVALEAAENLQLPEFTLVHEDPSDI